MNKKPYSDTTVSAAKSQSDIHGLLSGSSIGGVQWTTWPSGKSILRFEISGDAVKHMVCLTIDPSVQGTPYVPPRPRRAGKKKPGDPRELHEQQEARRLHRTLYWYVKSKLEAIDAGLETPEQAWFPSIEGPRGLTVYQEMREGLREMKSGDFGSMPALPAAEKVKQ